MANLGFKDQFEEFVVAGTKRHTIRRGKRWSAGMRADLYVRPRQKDMRLLFRAMVTKVSDIRIEEAKYTGLSVTIDGQNLSFDEVDALFYADGFRAPAGCGTPAMQAFLFWRGNLPFDGQIVYWSYDQRFMDKPAQKGGRK